MSLTLKRTIVTYAAQLDISIIQSKPIHWLITTHKVHVHVASKLDRFNNVFLRIVSGI